MLCVACAVSSSGRFRAQVVPSRSTLSPGCAGLERLERPRHSPLLIISSSLSAVTNKHHFADGPLLYQFRMNFRRRRRLIELLHERGRGIPESHDSPFCLRKQNSDGSNTSFLSGRRTLGTHSWGSVSWEDISNTLTLFIFSPHARRFTGVLGEIMEVMNKFFMWGNYSGYSDLAIGRDKTRSL